MNSNSLLARPQCLSEDFFSVNPDAVTWGDVSVLSDYCRNLREVTDQTYREGEYAESRSHWRTLTVRS